MKKLIILTILLVPLLLVGCGDSEKDNIANIPFEVLDKNDFTLEELSKKVNSPMVFMVDDGEKLQTAYDNIRKSENNDDLEINEDEDLIIIAFRGNQGNCEDSDLKIKKISKEKDDLKVEIIIDEGKEETKKCSVVMNPYSIVKINKEAIAFKKGMRTHLMKASDGELLNVAKLNSLPGFLE